LVPLDFGICDPAAVYRDYASPGQLLGYKDADALFESTIVFSFALMAHAVVA
jgi:hypothetical protein